MNFLPIGSVVVLESFNGEKIKVMIIGRAVTINEKIFQYAGVAYPYGFLDSKNGIYFNGEQIKKIYHEGYIDEEEDIYSKKLEEAFLEALNG